MINPAVADMSRQDRIGLELHQGQGGRHIFAQGYPVFIGAAIDSGDRRIEPGQRITTVSTFNGTLRETEIVQVRQGRAAGDVSSVEAAKTVSHGEQANLGEHQQAIFIARANASGVSGTGIVYRIVEKTAGSMDQAHWSAHPLAKKRTAGKEHGLSEP
jgi:hypothetical protein